MQLNKKSFAIACGILCGAGVFITTLCLHVLGRPEGLSLLTSAYPGYSVSVGGAFIGLVYGFIDGVIGGFLFSWLYNKILPKA